ncbi:MAG: DJ-1/PfpI family protein [Candidatus Bathyarchaeota archaeon]|nr:MAG: DJ-1/PfpI family protein [Candidatus Bathyarchaeota archaeon]
MGKWLKPILLLAVISIIGGVLILNPLGNERIEGVEVLALLGEDFDYQEFRIMKARLEARGARVTASSFEAGWLQGDGGSYTPEITFSEVDALAYDVFFIPGGGGPYDLIHNSYNDIEGHQTPMDILIQANEAGRLIAAICHGPEVLAAADVVNGTHVTCYDQRHLINKLRAAGAIVDTSRSVIRDGNIITGRSPVATPRLAREIVNALSGER